LKKNPLPLQQKQKKKPNQKLFRGILKLKLKIEKNLKKLLILRQKMIPGHLKDYGDMDFMKLLV